MAKKAKTNEFDLIQTEEEYLRSIEEEKNAKKKPAITVQSATPTPLPILKAGEVKMADAAPDKKRVRLRPNHTSTRISQQTIKKKPTNKRPQPATRGKSTPEKPVRRARKKRAVPKTVGDTEAEKERQQRAEEYVRIKVNKLQRKWEKLRSSVIFPEDKNI